MLSKKIIWWVIVLIILLILGGVAFYFARANKANIVPKEIAYQLEKDLGGSLSSSKNILIDRKFWRGKAETADGIEHNAFAIKVADQWKLLFVSDGDVPPGCEKMERLGFPKNFYDDCELEFPRAQTVDKLLEKKEISTPVQVIGKIEPPKEPGCNCVELSSGGKMIEIPNNVIAEKGDINIGDQVVVEVKSKGSVEVVSEIAEEESKIIESNSEVSTTTADPPAINFSNKDISEPNQDTSNLRRYTYSIYDIDNSFKPIQIIGN